MTLASPLPSLRGQLAGTSIGELMAVALDRKLSGSVVLETPVRDQSVLVVEAGQVTKAQTADPVALLGRLLTARGALDAASLEAALLLAVQGRCRLGQALLELQLLAPETLARGLTEQLESRLTWLGRLPLASTFAYYDHVDLLAHTPATRTEPLALLWRSLRDAARPHPRQGEVLESLAGSSLALSPAAAPERLALSSEEQRLVDVLRRGALSLPALLSGSALVEERARRLVYTLQLTHQLSVRGDGASHGRVPSLSTLALPSHSRPDCRVEHALERATRRARSRHGSDAPAEAARAFQAALLSVGRKRFAEAESFASVASGTEPGNPEYLALHAWLRMHVGALSTPAQAAQIIGALDRAVMKARESVSIRFYRAQVLKRLGRDEEAFKDFRFVARREPDNLDAVREVRLHLMRVREKQKVSGVFSRLFLR